MSLKQVAEYIEKNETEFLNEYGFYERWVIRDRFDLTQEDYAKLVNKGWYYRTYTPEGTPTT